MKTSTFPAATRSQVVVVGSANLDLVVHAQRAPEPGETVLGERLAEHPGGKGLNQAAAAARHAPTALVGRLGSDRAGEVLRAALTAADVDVTHVRTSSGDSGVAIVNLAADGENCITVISGANAELTATETTAALEALRPAVVVTQLEIPLRSVVAAARWAQANEARWVFNPSPVTCLTHTDADDEIHALLATANPLIVNAGEGRSILGDAASAALPEGVAAGLAPRVTSVVVTDGSRGAWVGDSAGLTLVTAPQVHAVDTTGAGDSFAGTMAALLASGACLEEAATSASAAAAVVVSCARSDR